jgi:hypothetical protein
MPAVIHCEDKGVERCPLRHSTDLSPWRGGGVLLLF